MSPQIEVQVVVRVRDKDTGEILGDSATAMFAHDGRCNYGQRVLFAGTDQGLEATLVPAAGFELVTLPARQVMGRGLAGHPLCGCGPRGTDRRRVDSQTDRCYARPVMVKHRRVP